MERRIIEFVAGLRSAGVRVSVAESEDTCRAVLRLGILNRDDFRETLRATLIKRVQDEPVFEELFPVYFGHVSQLANLMEKLSPPERQLLRQAVQTLLEQLNRQEGQAHGRPQRSGDIPPDARVENLTQMLQGLLTGQSPDQDTFEQVEQQIIQAGHQPAERDRQWWFQQRMVSRLGGRLWPNIRQPLPGLLRQTGMRSHSINNLMAGLDANLEALTTQTGQYVELNLARQWAEQHADRTQKAGNLMTRSLQNLSEREANLLRNEIRRLVAQLRSRIALRQKRAKRGTPDVRKTLRHNMRYGGIPLELKFKTRPLKPRLLLLCDISNSMRKIVEFALRLVYELQDQVSRVRTFTYIDTLEEISQVFDQSSPEIALGHAMSRLRPRHPNTDLGKCLALLLKHHPDTIDRRTTVIIVGDACNSWNDPRLDLMAKMQELGKEIIWFNPREPELWDANDSDMLKYLPYAGAVHRVSTMAELTAAVDKLLTH